MSEDNPNEKSKKKPLVREMSDEDVDDFDFWSDYSRSLIDGEMPMHLEWPKSFSQRVGKALEYADEKHHWHARKGTFIPYISHPLAVASIVYELGGQPDAVIAALLHDVVEDTSTTLKEIQDLFGIGVRQIVEDCSDSITDDQKQLSWAIRKHRYLEHLTKTSLGSLMVSFADKLHNARCIVRDFRGIGEAKTFRKFGDKQPGQIAKYYRSLAAVFLSRASDGFGADEDSIGKAYLVEFLELVTRIEAAALMFPTES